MNLNSAFRALDEMRDELIEFTMEMTRIKAVNPAFDGEGEGERAKFLEKKLREICDEVHIYTAIDDKGIERPNLIGIIYGENRERTLWLIGHMDTVPEGDLSLWSHDPYDPVLKDGKIYGRGTLDDGQAIVSAYFAAKTLRKMGIRPKYNLGLAFVADEEAGSRYGVEFLMDKGIFKPDDLVVVPDSGKPDGSFIEVAEKSAVWLKVTTLGKQAHASMPHTGVNAHRAAMKFALEVDSLLHEKYAKKDSKFDPPESTFEITKKEKNVDNVNTIPGKDVIYFDFRILPDYDVDEIISFVKDVAARHSVDGAKINVEVVQKSQAPPPTPEDSEVVMKLKEAIREIRGIEPVAGGIGGGTVAAFFRRLGIPAVVWMTADDVEHQPDEFCRVENCINDAKVFLHMLLS